MRRLPDLLAPAPAYLADQPVVGLWPADAVAAIEAILTSPGRHSMRQFAEAIGARAVNSPGDSVNVNTPADLATLGTINAGGGTLTVHEDATPGNVTGAIQPGTIIPNGAAYSGAGAYTVSVTAGRVYQWEKGANDINVVNGTITLTTSGATTALGSGMVLHGTPGAAVTATLRVGGFYTAVTRWLGARPMAPAALLAALTACRNRDLELQSTTVGPHRDDWEVRASGRALHSFASRGQQRLCLVALLFLQVSFLHLRRGEKPIILLASEIGRAHV